MKSFKYVRTIAFWLLLVLLAIVAAQLFTNPAPTAKQLTYTQFYSELNKNGIATATVGDTKVTGTLTGGTAFVAYIPSGAQAQVTADLNAKGVNVAVAPPSSAPWWSQLLTTLFPVLLVVVLIFFIMQQTQGGGGRVMQFGRSRARLHTDDRKTVTFEDVAGIAEVKEELQEIVDFLKHPKRYLELGARIPKGVLLMGPPGTGKTLVARAVAGEAGVPFFYISGSDFVEMFVGVGASRVRDLFDQAKKNSPAIVFIDEIDAVGRQRGAGYGGGHDEREQTLNQLLVEMDGFGVNEGIIVMAATNRPDVLDPALLRPGRFDRQVILDRPDRRARLEILQVHVRGKPLDKDVGLEALARRTSGFTGADLANLTNEAALLTARRRKKRIGMAELHDAIDRVIAGPEQKSRLLSPREREVVAYHEAGHALVAHLLPHCDPVHKISIIARGRALGYTMQIAEDDRHLVTRAELLDQVAGMLAGRVAEEIRFGDMSTGAQNDLENSTKLVRRMITEYGMSEELGPLTFGTNQDLVFLGRDIARDRNYSEAIAAAIDREEKRIITDCYRRAQDTLGNGRDRLDLLAKTLLEKETLEGDELQAALEGLAGPPARAAAAETAPAATEAAEEADPGRPPVVEKGRRLAGADA